MKNVKISIVTVCYNMEQYIEKTVLSVINQEYQDLEYIIIDGGSTDNTLSIVNRYKDRIAHIISEPDKGMYYALKKGLNMASGDVVGWINADDQYFPWTFSVVSEIFSKDSSIMWLSGMSAFSDEKGRLTKIFNHPGARPSRYIKNGWFREEVFGYLQQENMFWRKSLYKLAGGLDVKYRYAADFELWTRFANYAEMVMLSVPLAMYLRRNDSLSKSIVGKSMYKYEVMMICEDKTIFPRIIEWLFKNIVIRKMASLVVWAKTPLIFYSFRKKEFVRKTVLRSVSLNSLSDLRYEHIF